MRFSIALMSKLSYPKKMAVIAAIFLFPLTITFVILASNLNSGINASILEQKGLKYIDTVRPLYQKLAQHRGLVNTYHSGKTSLQADIINTRKEISAQIRAIDTINAEMGTELNIDALWNGIKNSWVQIEPSSFSSPAEKVFQEHTILIAKIYNLFELISNRSGLILDPALDTSFIIEALVYRLPKVTENLGQMRGLASGLASQRQISQDEKTQLITFFSNILSDSESADKALNRASHENPELESVLDTFLENRIAAFNKFINIINEQFLMSDFISVNSKDVFESGTQAIAANYKLYDALVPVLDTLLQERIDRLKSERIMLILIIIAALSISIYLFIGFYRSTIDVIQNLVQATDQIANGDLTIEVQSSTQDESSQIVDALNKMTKHLNGMVNQLRDNASLLATASEELSSTTSQAKTNSLEQQNQSEQITTAMNEMSSTVKEIAKNAEMLAAEVKNATNDSLSSQTVIDDTIRSINKLADGVGNAVIAMQELTQSSQEIGSVLTVIKGVAEQTNLLALNAAIEAARAGEHGRGFAVVADEVRVLATRTQDSAIQIEAMIENLQQHTKQAADVMLAEKENAQNVSQGTESATQSMHNIVESMTQISDMSTHVASAAEEQGLVSEEINRNVTHVYDLSSENLMGTEQIALASNELAKLASEMESIVQRFKV
ncbi:methyl-accepting chemotaxis protein [Methylophaga sp. OBS4]|uniref:methyl-accepting chemotaxis protein n=1 Tax=Methylophaga sp. OBS4 TaxID=2991935 RepID=UPI0022536413|nr:methyl-accepting chemotaxis protein [Methylophaga sp. OBS4]MCX4186670.1 methyl-accepting chemotaxis protein [Methylophaga sp. OBS4]